jgi:hypothetical protein
LSRFETAPGGNGFERGKKGLDIRPLLGIDHSNGNIPPIGQPFPTRLKEGKAFADARDSSKKDLEFPLTA